jgi:leader peptidase (prepilin peptidase)/N-methyltransferase
MIEVTMWLGAALGAAWVALVIFKPDAAAYGGLLGAGAGALAGGGLVWVIRALYFYARGVEGMGLGDVKLMAVIGAFFGWSGAVLTIFLAAPLGLIVGLALAWRGREGLRTAVPFGVCLGVAALALMFIARG